MGLKYNSIEQHVTPRPRSKRLREVSGGAVVTGQGTSSVEGGLGDGHTHANLKDLDKISFDDEKYLYVTQRENDVLVKDKAKCGTADNLSAESTDWEKILRKDIDDRTDHSLSIGKDLTVECKATISELMATAMSSATATISDLTATALKATSVTILGALTAATVGATTINAKNCIAITDALSIDYSASYVRLQSIAKDISLNPNGYYVGIGTTTPQYKLDVNGNARIVANLYADSTVGTSSYVSHTIGWRADNQGNADFRTVYSDELNVLAFTAQVSQALAGSDYLTKSVSKLSANFTIPNAVGQTARLIVDDLEGFPGIQCFANGDYIRLRPINRNGGLIVGNVYGTVALDTSFGVNGFSNGTQAYTFTVKSITNGAGLIVYKGAEILDYGTSGSGLIQRTTLDAAGSPYMDIDTWANDPSVGSNLTTHVRLGNLGGIASCSGYGLYSDNVFLTKNILIGDFTKAGNYLSFDTQNGLQIKLGGARVATTSDISSSILAASSYTNSQVAVLNNALSAKVSQADFNALGQRVTTAETNISANSNSISAQATNISNLTGRISTAEAKITPDAINLTVKSQVDTSYNNAVSAAATDATTKANAAYSNAVSYTNSQITATNNSITAAVNGIQIGGTNILRNTRNWTTTDYWYDNGGGISIDSSITYLGQPTLKTTGPQGITGSWYRVEENTYYTYSAMLYVSSAITIDGNSPLHKWVSTIYNTAHNEQNQTTNISSIPAKTWTLASVTFLVPSGSTYFKPFFYGWDSGVQLNVAYIKCEKGNKATDWTPAPEDIDANIATSQSVAISTAASNAAALYVTQTAYSSQVTILQNSINAKVSQTDFNALGSRISTAESNITQNANNIASKVSQTDYTGATIASLINQSAGTVVISANHINIQGAVTFSSFSSDLQSTINGKATTSYVDSNVSTCLNQASTAQSTANTALSNAAAANNTLVNALGGKTIIVGGYIDTNLLEANSILTKALTSSTIIANNATIANLNMVNANVSGVINATSGKFGCLITDGTEYGEIYNEGLDSEAMLVFTYKSKNVSTKIGTNIYPAMAGIRGLASFKNSETNYNYGSGYNYGISVTAENADTNVALSIGGGYVQGFALKVGMFYGGTESNPTLISRDVNVALLMTKGWYQFPDMQTCDDGHLLMIKRLVAGNADSEVRVKTNLGWHVSNNTTLIHTQAGLIVDQGWYGTDVKIGSLMDSMTYIYCRDLNLGSYHGMWVEWKNPRDW